MVRADYAQCMIDAYTKKLVAYLMQSVSKSHVLVQFHQSCVKVTKNLTGTVHVLHMIDYMLTAELEWLYNYYCSSLTCDFAALLNFYLPF